MPGKLSGKVAIVTGASAGIGRASALALAAEGARVVITARRQERLDALASEINAMNTQAYPVAGDANDEVTAKRCVETALNEAGRIDILLNNAGMGNYKNLADTSLEEYDQLMNTNMRTTFIFPGKWCL